MRRKRVQHPRLGDESRLPWQRLANYRLPMGIVVLSLQLRQIVQPDPSRVAVMYSTRRTVYRRTNGAIRWWTAWTAPTKRIAVSIILCCCSSRFPRTGRIRIGAAKNKRIVACCGFHHVFSVSVLTLRDHLSSRKGESDTLAPGLTQSLAFFSLSLAPFQATI